MLVTTSGCAVAFRIVWGVQSVVDYVPAVDDLGTPDARTASTNKKWRAQGDDLELCLGELLVSSRECEYNISIS